MSEITFIQISKEELCQVIRETIVTELSRVNSLEEDKIIRIDDVCEILSVSKVTIHKWKKEGRLPFHRLGNRIYFKKKEIIVSMKHEPQTAGARRREGGYRS